MSSLSPVGGDPGHLKVRDMAKRLGIIVGGGPAPGINGVISAVTLESLRQGWEVIGFRDGFKWLVRGDTSHVWNLSSEDVRGINIRGGSILGTARVNPAKSEEDMARVLAAFKSLGLDHLVTIGGDDTAYSGSKVYSGAGGAIRVAHVPKTIDNDLPLPPGVPTFGYETARQVGVSLVNNLNEDARTCGRWFIVVSMGRAAGHLALGIGKAAAAAVTIIPEEFVNSAPTLDSVADIILGSILKSRAEGRDHGVAVLAEGLVESIGEKGLGAMSEGQLASYGKIERDPHGNLRMAEIDFGRMIRDRLAEKLRALKLGVSLTSKDIGYELRCADPVPFDAEYTRDLGYGAVKFLISDDSARFGAIISLVEGKTRPLPFESMLNPATKRLQTRRVDVSSQGYECARRFMTRVEPHDLSDASRLSSLAKASGITPEAFRALFAAVA